MSENLLAPILEYQMTPLEAKAYKIGLLWEKLATKEFPNYSIMRFRRDGDPRKSALFKYAYKLARETDGVVPDREYRLYITAQLQVLKGIRKDEIHPLIVPNCLVGRKAWHRWRMWKSRWDKQMSKAQNSEDIDVNDTFSRIEAELKKTRKFLDKQLPESWTCENIEYSYKNKDMLRWVALGRVSPFYVLLSKCLSEVLGHKDREGEFGVDLSVYKRSLTPSVEKAFKEIFPEDS